MTAIYKARLEATEAAVECLVQNLPGLSFETEQGRFWLWGPPLGLNGEVEDLRTHLAVFAKRANALLALSDPNLEAVNPGGAVRIEDGESRSIIALADTLIFETTFYPVTLSARGGARAQQRPLAERLADLCAREPLFERAAAMLAASGDDWRELFKVMEIIEKAHGGCPKKRRRASRAAFFRKLEIEEKEWEALHRSARPYRHADAHDDGGPTVRAWQGRLLIQHALKLWLDRAVRV